MFLEKIASVFLFIQEKFKKGCYIIEKDLEMKILKLLFIKKILIA
jgi:hypothetical protein